jgi:hypothetical protein
LSFCHWLLFSPFLFPLPVQRDKEEAQKNRYLQPQARVKRDLMKFLTTHTSPSPINSLKAQTATLPIEPCLKLKEPVWRALHPPLAIALRSPDCPTLLQSLGSRGGGPTWGVEGGNHGGVLNEQRQYLSSPLVCCFCACNCLRAVPSASTVLSVRSCAISSLLRNAAEVFLCALFSLDGCVHHDPPLLPTTWA